MRNKKFITASVIAALVVGIRWSYVEYKKRVDVNRHILAFEKSGSSSPTLVLLHGILASHRYWEEIAPLLSEKNQVVALDLLGFGKSPKPKASYTVQDHLAAIDATLAKTIPDVERLVLVGHSMGSILSLNFADLHPGKIKALVLIAPPIITSEDDLIEDMKASTSSIMVTMTFSKFWGGLVCKIHELAPFLMYPFVRIFESDLPAHVAADATHHVWEAFSGSLDHVLRAQRFEDLIARISPSIPILIISASDDSHTKKDVLEKLSRNHSNLQLQWVEGRHNFPLKQPKVTSDMIQNFLNSL